MSEFSQQPQRSLWEELQDIMKNGLPGKEAAKFARMLVGYMIFCAILSVVFIVLKLSNA